MSDGVLRPVRIRAWAEGDLPLLERLLGHPAMTVHIGGPESPQKLRERHDRYLSFSSPGGVFAVTAGSGGPSAGWVGYWETAWQGEDVWEIGWNVLHEFQGKGVATAAASLAIERARAEGAHRFVHSFPSLDNAASNAVCRKLGFVCLGAVDIEYPPGRPMRSNDWCLDLLGEPAL